MLVALTRAVPPSIVRCELTHLERVPIDLRTAMAQHGRYEELLRELGCRVERVSPAPSMPDSVFIEDVAIVLDEIAIITRPGAESRREESAAVATALARYRPLRCVTPPATMDGGDVLRLGRRLFVGVSTRTSADAVDQLARIVEPLAYTVVPVRVNGCLHLKSAVTQVAEDVVVINPAWIDGRLFEGCRVEEVHPDEPFAANVLMVGDAVVCSENAPRTCERLSRHGVSLQTVATSELAKAEGALTCCSLMVRE